MLREENPIGNGKRSTEPGKAGRQREWKWKERRKWKAFVKEWLTWKLGQWSPWKIKWNKINIKTHNPRKLHIVKTLKTRPEYTKGSQDTWEDYSGTGNSETVAGKSIWFQR